MIRYDTEYLACAEKLTNDQLIYCTGPKTEEIRKRTKNHKCSAVAEMGDRLAAIDMGRKLGGCAPLGEGSWVSI